MTVSVPNEFHLAGEDMGRTGWAFSPRDLLVLIAALAFFGPVARAAQPVRVADVTQTLHSSGSVHNCLECRPYLRADILPVQGLPRGALNLSGPIKTSPGEKVQGGWATSIVQANTYLTPNPGELARLSQPLDLLFGEALTDATWQSPQPATRVKNPSVIFQVPISFTGTGLQYTGSDYSCGGPVCTPDYISDGLYAVYFARVEDCLSDADHPTVQVVKDNHGNAIPCNTADGIPGRAGRWYDIASAWKATAHLNMSPLEKMTTDTVSGVFNVPATLPMPANSVRIEIMMGLQDDLKSWVNSVYWGDWTKSGPYGGPEHAATRIALQMPTITVLPAAFVQMKVLPYTIVYRPPGDQSTGTYTATQAFGTTMTVGNNTTLDNSETFEHSYDVKNDDKVTALIATADLADDQSQTKSNVWDTNTLIGTGLVVSGSHQVGRSFNVGASTTDTSIVPAAPYVTPNTCTAANFATANCTVQPAETYQQEPFWADRVVLLLNPQAALWDFNGTPDMQLLGASNFTEVSIRDLDTCSQNTNQNAWKLPDGQYLSPGECHDLAVLDPFYGTGQGFSPETVGRGLAAGSGSYGRDPLNPASPATVKFSDIFNSQTQQSASGTATYSTVVTDILGFSWSAGLSLAYQQGLYGLNLGFNASTTLTQGEKTTNGLTMKVAYSNSTVTTDTNATEIDGAFGDDHDFDTPDCQKNSGDCYTPAVHVFIDNLFGSYMFRDADAPCAVSCLLKPMKIPHRPPLSHPQPSAPGATTSPGRAHRHN